MYPGNIIHNIPAPAEPPIAWQPAVICHGQYLPTLEEEIEGFLVTLPGRLIKRAAMTQILALLHRAIPQPTPIT
jgi:hypothetical protein